MTSCSLPLDHPFLAPLENTMYWMDISSFTFKVLSLEKMFSLIKKKKKKSKIGRIRFKSGSCSSSELELGHIGDRYPSRNVIAVPSKDPPPHLRADFLVMHNAVGARRVGSTRGTLYNFRDV